MNLFPRVLVALVTLGLCGSLAQARPHLFHRHRHQSAKFAAYGSSCTQAPAAVPCQPSIPQPMPPVIPQGQLPAAKNVTVSLEAELLACFNAERVRYGLPLLALDKSLCDAAQTHTAWNAASGRLFHDPRAGSGEIIAWNYSSASDVTGGWMRSSGHRAVITTGSYTRVGFGRTGQFWCARVR